MVSSKGKTWSPSPMEKASENIRSQGTVNTWGTYASCICCIENATPVHAVGGTRHPLSCCQDWLRDIVSARKTALWIWGIVIPRHHLYLFETLETPVTGRKYTVLSVTFFVSDRQNAGDG